MPLRSGKEYQCKDYLKVILPKETRPFNMVLLPELGKQYVVNIDFDESSKAWRENKIENDNGTFIYKYYIDFMEWVRRYA